MLVLTELFVALALPGLLAHGYSPRQQQEERTPPSAVQLEPLVAKDGRTVTFTDVAIRQGAIPSIEIRAPKKLPQEVPSPPISASAYVDARDLGAVVVGIPFEGGLNHRPTRSVFGLPKDGAGTLWFLDATAEGQLLSQSPGREHGPYGGYGSSVALLPDIDGDGAPELIVGAPGTVSDPGAVFVVSSGSRQVLHVIKSPGNRMLFGIDACSVGDVDADGVRDIAVLSGEQAEGGYAVSVLVMSTKTGKVICTLIERRFAGSLGHTRLKWLPGSDNGLLLVALQSGTPRTLEAVRIPSGESAWVVRAAQRFEGIGWSLDLIQDLDGDGVMEVVAGDLRYGGFPDLARVRIVSGRNGNVLRSTNGLLAHPEAGMSVTTCPDIDGDGFQDVIATQEGPIGGGGSLLFISGRTGQGLKKYVFQGGFWQIGHTLSVGADWDGDGLRDLCLSSFQRGVDYPGTSALGLVSLKTGAFIYYINWKQLGALISGRRSTK